MEDYFEVAKEIVRAVARDATLTHAIHPDIPMPGRKWGLVSARCGKPVKWNEHHQEPTCPRCAAELTEDAKGDF